MGKEFENWELPRRVSVGVAKQYFHWLGLELAHQVMCEWGDEQTIGAELEDIKETLEALQGEQGEVIIDNCEMSLCGVAFERA